MRRYRGVRFAEPDERQFKLAVQQWLDYRKKKGDADVSLFNFEGDLYEYYKTTKSPLALELFNLCKQLNERVYPLYKKIETLAEKWRREEA